MNYLLLSTVLLAIIGTVSISIIIYNDIMNYKRAKNQEKRRNEIIYGNKETTYLPVIKKIEKKK